MHAIVAWAFCANYSGITTFFCSFIMKPRGILGSQIFLITMPLMLHTMVFNNSNFFLWNFYTELAMPADFWNRLYSPQNSVAVQIGVNFLPTFHLGKMYLRAPP